VSNVRPSEGGGPEEVGKAVRETIEGLGGTMPEDEPALDDVKEKKQLEAAEPKKLEKKD